MKNPVQKLKIINPRTRRENSVRAWNIDFAQAKGFSLTNINSLENTKNLIDRLFASVKTGSSSTVAVARMRRIVWQQWKATYRDTIPADPTGKFRVCCNKEHEAFLLDASSPKVIRYLEEVKA